MNVEELKWLWKVSAAVCGQPDVRAQKLSFKKTRILKRRFSYISKAARLIDSLQVFMQPRQGSPLQRAMALHPELVGVVIWPFTCSSWDAKTCLQRIDQHFRVIETMNANLDFPCNDALTLLDLSDVATNLRVVLDQPKWFMREGLFVINLFALDARIYSLAFSFAFDPQPCHTTKAHIKTKSCKLFFIVFFGFDLMKRVKIPCRMDQGRDCRDRQPASESQPLKA